MAAFVGFTASFSVMKPRLLAKLAVLPPGCTVQIQLSLEASGSVGFAGRGILDGVLFDGTGFCNPGEMICHQQVQSDLGS